jgi:putative peptidoglycan lipid II flippase
MSVLLNVFISIIFFREIGFLIIPIATTISSWFNAILLFVFLKKKNLFSFNLVFIDRFIKILIASVLMGVFFDYIIYYFNDNFLYQANSKAIYLVGAVILGLGFYLLIAISIKAFKRSDINLNY